MLHISNLTVFYKSETLPALKDFNLVINSNGLIIIAGNSGSGKSTFAKAIFNLLPKDSNVSGSISFDSQNMTELKQSQLFKLVGFLPQFPSDYVLNLLVHDEIAFPLENLGFSKAEINQRITTILEQLKISHLEYRVVTELSSGELQKVALATAMISQPAILVLDEPFARIDSDSELTMINILKELKETTIVIILEHHLDYILELADHVILLDKGQISTQGPAQQVIENLNENKPEISQIIIPPNQKNLISYSNTLTKIQNFLRKKDS